MNFRANTNEDVDTLNRRYGAPGRIVFTPSPTGFPVVAMACQYGSVRLSLYGAHVLDYRPTGHAPVLFMSKATNLAPGTAIRGGIPVCWPWFGRCGEPGSGAHGFARKSAWQVVGSEYSEEESTIHLRLVSTDETKKLWPHDFVLDYTLTLSMKLTLALKTENTGRESFSITEGFHPYFRVMERDHVTVRGLDGCEFCDARETDVAEGWRSARERCVRPCIYHAQKRVRASRPRFEAGDCHGEFAQQETYRVESRPRKRRRLRESCAGRIPQFRLRGAGNSFPSRRNRNSARQDARIDRRHTIRCGRLILVLRQRAR